MVWVAATFALCNLAALAVFVGDKLAAKMRWRRVPERRLVLLCAVGGGLGAFFAMALVRHKTQHRELRRRCAGASLLGLGLFFGLGWAVTKG
jgi:uncharacterized membrane protein YsdA (DUF1294 family)